MSASTTKTKNQPSRKPVLLDYLKAFTKDKLIFAARQLCITYSKLKKDELAEKICTEMQKPEIAAKRFAIMPDENIQAFEAALEKKCFHPTYSEYALLLPFISMGYIVSYPDDCFEAVKEARTVYKKINTADFQAHRQQLAWLLDCITAMCDGINYLTHHARDDFFRCAYDALLPQGLLLFDFKRYGSAG